MKITPAFFLIVFPCLAWAQFERGQAFLGGSISVSAATTNSNQYNYKETNSQLSIAPSFGYFLNSKIAVGGGIGYSTSVQKSGNLGIPNQKYSSHNFSISPFVRYFFPVSNSFYIALQGQLNFSRGTATNFVQPNGTLTTSPLYNLGATISPIFIFFPSPKWGIEASIGSLGYTYTRYLPNVSSTGTFSLSSGTFAFGVAYYFKRKGN